jgi:hypothetical protein
MRDTIEMAREAGLLTWLKPPEDVIERFKVFEALVRADEREALQAEVLEQCRINGMSAEREDALRAELARLKASMALDKKADNARELGLDYEPAVQEGRDWSLLEATQESLREHMAEIKRLKAAQPAPVQEPRGYQWLDTAVVRNENAKLSAWHPLYTTPPAAQPVPVKTYSGGKPWPVAPKPWVGLTADEMLEALTSVDPETKRLPVGFSHFACAIETKLKGKNHDQ